MEDVEVSGGAEPIAGGGNVERDQVLVQRKTLEAVLDKWKQTLELLSTTGCIQDDDESEYEATDDDGDSPQPSRSCCGSSPPSDDGEADMDLTPNQLRDDEHIHLSSLNYIETKKGKLRKVWDGSKVIYNVASWGTTAIGIYQNPTILRAASTVFWTSCNVVSKLF